MHRDNGNAPTGEDGAFNAKKIASLIGIAGRALEVDACEQKRRLEDKALRTAYQAWKSRRGIQHVERDSVDWTLMLNDTTPEYFRLGDACRDERNARKRLATAIARHRNI